MGAKYYMVKDWAATLQDNRYNFFLQVYDENYKEIDHPANDRNFANKPFRTINAQMKRAINIANKYKLERIFKTVE